jgi:F0F1-type ATP synthase delta subunit
MKHLFSYFVYDLAQSLESNPSKVFDASVASLVSELSLKTDTFVDEVAVAQRALEGQGVESVIAKSFATTISKVVLPEYYEGSCEFSKGAFGKALQSYLTERSYHEVVRDALEVAQVLGVRVGHVQVAIQPSKAQVAKIVKDFTEMYPDAMLALTVQPDVLGGVRLFIDDTVIDRSWQSQLQTILNV